MGEVAMRLGLLDDTTCEPDKGNDQHAEAFATQERLERLGSLAIKEIYIYTSVCAIHKLHASLSPMNQQVLSWSNSVNKSSALRTMDSSQREALEALSQKNDDFIAKHAGAINVSMKESHRAFPWIASMVTNHHEIAEHRYEEWLEDDACGEFYHRRDKFVSLGGETIKPDRDNAPPPFD